MYFCELLKGNVNFLWYRFPFQVNYSESWLNAFVKVKECFSVLCRSVKSTSIINHICYSLIRQ